MVQLSPREILFALLQVYNEDGGCVNQLASNLLWFVVFMRGIIGIIMVYGLVQVMLITTKELLILLRTLAVNLSSFFVAPNNSVDKS